MLINEDKKIKVAIISSLSGGLGHYCAHLVGPLSKYCYVKCITYPQLDLTGVLVKSMTDPIVKQYIKWPRFDLDESNPSSIVAIEKYMKARSINIVNLHIGTTVKRKILYFTTLLFYMKQNNHRKFIFTLHDVLPFDEDKNLIKLLKSFYSLADYYTVGNEYEKEKLMKYFNVKEDNISIIPHGVYNLFDRNIYSPDIAKSYLGLPRDKKIILFFGFLREYKGLEYLIKATKILSKTNNNFVLYIVSGLKYASKDLMEKYLRLIKKLNLQDRIILNLNYLDSWDIEPVFKSADIVALPYTHASQSGVEMMAFGFKKPVILTDIFYDKIWVKEKAGLIARAKDPQSLADKLKILLDDPERSKELGNYGFQFANQQRNWVEIAEKYFSVYKKVSA